MLHHHLLISVNTVGEGAGEAEDDVMDKTCGLKNEVWVNHLWALHV